ncbi:MAG: GatB/YqeY domain-containing protein [Candidatus Vogelbacteria bacterium]|nr:GatB/YqeY domain-containing protein [Candidatus Vogelbacteria bacterium]
MSLHEQIKNEIKEAMKAKDQVKLTVVRGLVSAFTNEAVAKGKTPTDLLTDEEVLAVIKRTSKQRKDSIDQFIAGGRPELADDEKVELAILETYLPAMMSLEEIKKVVEAKKAELGMTDKSKAGQFVGVIMKELSGRADGVDVKQAVDESFA